MKGNIEIIVSGRQYKVPGDSVSYDNRSFRVRHAYSTRAGNSYSQLAKILRNKISPEVRESLYSTVSRPFLHPTTDRIAIKAINHYGYEALQIYTP